jgi:hypothetical protein
VGTRFLRIYGFSSCILWKFSRAIYCDVPKEETDPEKNTLSCAKCITSEQWSILVLKCGKIQEEKTHLGKQNTSPLYIYVYIYIYFDGKCKIAVEKFRSCSSQAEYVSLLLWQKTF